LLEQGDGPGRAGGTNGGDKFEDGLAAESLELFILALKPPTLALEEGDEFFKGGFPGAA
jgi:hypothetical protein